MAAALPDPGNVGLRKLAEALSTEVEEREDDEDWEMEDWPKDHVLEQLRQLPPIGLCSIEDDMVRVCVGESPVAATSALALSPGVSAEFQPGGELSRLIFARDNPAALKRLSWLTEPPDNSSG